MHSKFLFCILKPTFQMQYLNQAYKNSVILEKLSFRRGWQLQIREASLNVGLKLFIPEISQPYSFYLASKIVTLLMSFFVPHSYFDGVKHYVAVRATVFLLH